MKRSEGIVGLIIVLFISLSVGFVGYIIFKEQKHSLEASFVREAEGILHTLEKLGQHHISSFDWPALEELQARTITNPSVSAVWIEDALSNRTFGEVNPTPHEDIRLFSRNITFNGDIIGGVHLVTDRRILTDLLTRMSYFLIFAMAIIICVTSGLLYLGIRIREQERHDRFRSEFLANMSHELRTPLNAILGFSGTIKEEIWGPVGHKKYSEYIDDIFDSGQYLLELINDVLDLSAIDAKKLKLKEEKVDLAKVSKAAFRIIKPRADKGEIHLNTNIADDLPLLYADERRVKQILLNLLSNAIKFTPPKGRVSLDIELDHKKALTFKLTDSGIGMSKKELAMAMMSFGQAESTLARVNEGSGLGLPLTKGLLGLHGGTLDIVSYVGKGTTVTVQFPPERSILAETFKE